MNWKKFVSTIEKYFPKETWDDLYLDEIIAYYNKKLLDQVKEK